VFQLLSILVQFTEPISNGENLFAKLFLEKNSAAEALTLFTVEDMLDRVVSIVRMYYGINSEAVFYYTADVDNFGDPLPVKMLVEYHPELALDAPFVVGREFVLNQELPLGPMNGSRVEAKAFLNHTETLTLQFVLKDNVSATQFGHAPMNWRIDIMFRNAGGIFTAELWTVRYILNDVFLYRLGWIPGLIILVSFVSLVFGVKAVYSSYAVMKRTKRRWQSVPKHVLKEAFREVKAPGVLPVYAWSEIPMSVKLDFFSSWNAMECVGEVCLIVGCIIGFVRDHGLPVSDESRLFIGAGSMILCINFIKYLEYWKKFSALVLTLQGSFLRNLRFIVSVVPLYMGFLVCGFVMFAPYSPYFSSFDTTAVTLFALINGDDTHAIFKSLRDNYPYPKIAQAYLFSFDMLFITLVLNVFLYIIEDAYQAAAVWINGAAEKLSRSHRHRRADTPLPRNWQPTLGSVEFDIPTLFRVLETAIKIVDDEQLRKSAHDDGIGYLHEYKDDSDDAYSRKHEGESRPSQEMPSKRRTGQYPIEQDTSSSLSDYGFSDDDDEYSTSLKEKRRVMDPQHYQEGEMKGNSNQDVSTPALLQNAIENAVSQSQLQFQRQVERTIRAMQDQYSQRIQRQVSDLIRRSSIHDAAVRPPIIASMPHPSAESSIGMHVSSGTTDRSSE